MPKLYGFAYTESALTFLQQRVPGKLRGQIKRKIEALAREPFPSGCKKLHGATNNAEPIFRIRSGDYRILYSVRNSPETIVVLAINHRKDVYR